MNDSQAVAEALKTLAKSNQGRTKIARLREQMPNINAAQAAGVSHQLILDALNKDGFDLTLKAYSVMLYRIRKQELRGGGKVPPTVKAIMSKVAGQATTQSKPATNLTQLVPESVAPQVSKPGDPVTFDWETQRDIKPEW